MTRLRVGVEATPKRAFASALDWPGLARGGRDEARAIEALAAAVRRYSAVVAGAGIDFDPDDALIEVVARAEGNASTEFGVPGAIFDADREPADAAEAGRLASLVGASWAALDRVAANAPEELRKGPRGGGRDRSKIVAHVNEADAIYAGQIGVSPARGDVAALRAAMIDALRRSSDGSPLGGRKWPLRYAARRIAWHALDHAWEIEDRTDPA